MKVRLGTVTVGEAARRAINHHLGKPGLADAQAVRDFFLTSAETELGEVLTAMNGARVDEPTASR